MIAARAWRWRGRGMVAVDRALLERVTRDITALDALLTALLTARKAGGKATP